MNRFHEKWAGLSPAARGLRIAGIAVAAVVGTAFFGLVFGWLVMLLWNWLMPTIFHLGMIGYWEAFGIVILGKLIFGGIPGGRGHGHRNPWRGNPWEGKGGRDDWRFYREFWEKEGHQAFERWVQEKKTRQDTQSA